MSGLTTDMARDVQDWIADVVPHPAVPDGGGGRPMVRVGIDLTSVDEVAASIARFGDRYVARMFTPHEQAFCRIGDGPEANRPYRVESLAARFAAKEAVLKVLRPTGPRPVARHRGVPDRRWMVRVAPVGVGGGSGRTGRHRPVVGEPHPSRGLGRRRGGRDVFCGGTGLRDHCRCGGRGREWPDHERGARPVRLTPSPADHWSDVHWPDEWRDHG